MTEPPFPRPDTGDESKNTPRREFLRVGGLRLASRKAFRPLDTAWPRRKTLVATPLQQLLDPHQALLAAPTPIQDAPHLAPLLPEFQALQTQATLIGLPPRSERHQLLGAAQKPLTTLDESVVAALIRALYDALPDDLGAADVWDVPEKTASGNIIGRPRANPSTIPTQIVPPTTGTALRPPEALGAAQPRQYLRGVPDLETLQVTRQQLALLELADLPDTFGTPLSAREVLGYGEVYFLRAQSALWAWRTHRQANLQLHTDGPPMQGRNVLIEQRIGPLTLLLGNRVTRLIEGERHWGFTLSSLSDQVLRSRETFLVQWLEDDAVVFTFDSAQQIALPSLGFLGPVHAAVRRVITQGYLRNMRDMTADADGYE